MPETNAGTAGKTKGLRRRVLYVSLPDPADRICCGCETCQLMCSLQNTGTFIPKKSHIKAVPLWEGAPIPVTLNIAGG